MVKHSQKGMSLQYNNWEKMWRSVMKGICNSTSHLILQPPFLLTDNLLNYSEKRQKKSEQQLPAITLKEKHDAL